MKNYEQITIHKFGAPDVLSYETKSIDTDIAKGIVVEVLALGVGFADIMAQRGGYMLAPKRPFQPGYDFIGRIMNVGNSTIFKDGDLVGAMLTEMGTYKDVIVVEEKYLVKLPEESNLLKYGASILNYLTAYCILEKKAKVKAGDTVFIQGVSGGVGLALAQIGRLKNINMIGTASKSKFNLLKGLGVDLIDYKNFDYLKEIKRKYPKGIDAAFDAMGGINLARATRIVKRGGTVVSYGFSGTGFGGNAEMIKGIFRLAFIYLIPNGIKVKTCGTPMEVKKDNTWYQKTLKMIFNNIKEGKLNPLIGQVFDLKEANKAHSILENRQAKGKVMLKTRYFENYY